MVIPITVIIVEKSKIKMMIFQLTSFLADDLSEGLSRVCEIFLPDSVWT